MLPQLILQPFHHPLTRLEYLRLQTGYPFASVDDYLLSAEGTSIGIDDIRELQHFLQFHPKSQPQKTAAILEAEKLTSAAQNALLKLLEEPPAYSRIFLLAPSTHALLPTVLSRCRVVPATGQPATSPISAPTLPANLSEAIALVDTLARDKQALEDFTTRTIFHYRQLLLLAPSKSYLYNLTLALYTQKLLRQNVNPKLALDAFFFNLKTASA